MGVVPAPCAPPPPRQPHKELGGIHRDSTLPEPGRRGGAGDTGPDGTEGTGEGGTESLGWESAGLAGGLRPGSSCAAWMGREQPEEGRPPCLSGSGWRCWLGEGFRSSLACWPTRPGGSEPAMAGRSLPECAQGWRLSPQRFPSLWHSTAQDPSPVFLVLLLFLCWRNWGGDHRAE